MAEARVEREYTEIHIPTMLRLLIGDTLYFVCYFECMNRQSLDNQAQIDNKLGYLRQLLEQISLKPLTVKALINILKIHIQGMTIKELREIPSNLNEQVTVLLTDTLYGKTGTQH